MRALAEDQGSQAIGVILLGNASDGALGLEAIKADGGITLVQDEQSATYTGMLRSATGVDFEHYKYKTVKRRIFRRMALHQLENFEDYLKYLRGDRAEAEALQQEVLIKK